MTVRHATQKEHDLVILASARTYESYKQNGYQVSVNLTGHENHDIGKGNFPDLVVWKEGGENGTNYIIEEVETAETVNEQEVAEWIRYAGSCQVFYLIVPKDSMEAAKELVNKFHIRVTMIQGYTIGGDETVKFFMK